MASEPRLSLWSAESIAYRRACFQEAVQIMRTAMTPSGKDRSWREEMLKEYKTDGCPSQTTL